MLAIGAVAAALSIGSGAQQVSGISRIGFLGSGNPKGFALQAEALRQGLRDYGYIEGINVHIEYRWAEGKLERLEKLAADLVRQKVTSLSRMAYQPPAPRSVRQPPSRSSLRSQATLLAWSW